MLTYLSLKYRYFLFQVSLNLPTPSVERKKSIVDDRSVKTFLIFNKYLPNLLLRQKGKARTEEGLSIEQEINSLLYSSLSFSEMLTLLKRRIVRSRQKKVLLTA